MSASAMAADIRLVPDGRQGNAPLHVDSTEAGGIPNIHRPETARDSAVRNGPASLGGGAQEPGVAYAGPGQGTLGHSHTPQVADNDAGRPILNYGH
ncbi:hypothetical protein EOD42_22690 [Rhodovarius crocodyli]|uniref:Uncharacterized protein n=1 Tax=Rhodovarius crocodyli TaxID=1979269 RepID=A0A437M1M7_9PROT|nr:hypothetical protein [Rhodovarius crocodyli]RVT91465.1 hypothetical protein EOD42_22690 [Rhodovarius crocodyli]